MSTLQSPPSSSNRAQIPALRDYQRAALDATLAGIASGQRRGYIELPTGTGKTAVCIAAAARLKGRGRVLIVAHRQELIAQLAALCRLTFGECNVGVVMAGQDECDRPVIVGSVPTLRGARLERLLHARSEPFAAVIVDECHHIAEKNSYGRLIARLEEHSPNLAVIGASAAPFRSDEARIQEVLTTCYFRRTLGEMRDAGWLVPLDWRWLPQAGVDLAELPTTKRGGVLDFEPGPLAVRVNTAAAVAGTVAATAPLLGDRQTLVFAVTVQHAHDLAAAYQGAGLRAAAIWGEMPGTDRAAILAAWRAGDLQLVVNVGILGEGFDYPEIAALVMARPTLSSIFYLQALGRGTRPAADKTDCLILDVAGNADLSDTVQVLLPDVASALMRPETISSELAGTLESRAAAIAGRQNTSAFLAWRYDNELGVHIAALGNEYVAVLSPSGAHGLYAGDLLNLRTRYRQPLWRSGEPLPFRNAEKHAVYIVDQLGVRRLASKRRGWRDTPPSPNQLAFIAQLDPHACPGEGPATKGEAAEHITCLLARPLIQAHQIEARRQPGKAGTVAGAFRASVTTAR